MKGYMWKRGLKADDKKSLKRFIFNSDSYKRKYFVLDDVKLELKYYSDVSKKTELGCMDLLTVSKVSFENNSASGEEMPSKFHLCLMNDFGDWSMCCDNEEDFNLWKREFVKIMKRREEGTSSDASYSKGSTRDTMSLTAPEYMIQRTVMDEAEFKGKTTGIISPHNNSSKAVARKSSSNKGKMSFLSKRRSNLHNDSFTNDMMLLQRTRLGEESAFNSYTGNVGIVATATFSQYKSLENLEFYQVLMSSCDDDLDIASRQTLVTKFLSECQFEFYMEEGEILITEGNKFDWVYFVVKGEIEQRKNWTSSPHHIDEKIMTGQCAGFVEVLHFNSVSTTTLLVGPGTICLKMSVSIFKKQFQRHPKEKERAIFSTSMDPSSTLYLERLTTFTFKRLSNLPLLKRQRVDNIQILSHIFSPVCIAAGDQLMKEGEASDDFYIILQGSCNVFQKSSLGADEMDEIVRSCRGGDWLGEAGLINIQSRLITAVAYSDVVALRTNAVGFKRFLDIVGPSVREEITQSTTSYLKTTLTNIPLFANIDENQIADICREVEIKELDRDTLLYDTGDKIENLYVILHGHIKCSISFVSGLDLSESPPFIDTMRENDFFGECAVLYDSSPSRLQYFTPKDVKVVVLCISAKKLKPFLPSTPILQLRFEERLSVRKAHMDLIDTLVQSISASLSIRHDQQGNVGTNGSSRSRSSSKQSLGHMADMKAKEALSMTDELMYLREEVKRLNGVPYPDLTKGRSQTRAVSTFKSTLRRIKSSYTSTPRSPKTVPRVPEKKNSHMSKNSMEAEFATRTADNTFFLGRPRSSLKNAASLNSDYGEDAHGVVPLESISDNSDEFLTYSPKNDRMTGNILNSDSEDDDDDDDDDSSVELVFSFNSKGKKSQQQVQDAMAISSDSEGSDDVDKANRKNRIRKEKMMKILNEEKKEKKEKQEKDKNTSVSPNATNTMKKVVAAHSPTPSPTKAPRAPATGAGAASITQSGTASGKKPTSINSSSNSQAELTSVAGSSEPFVVDAMYDRMLKMKLPEAAIRKKMTADGVPVQAIDSFFRNNVGL